MMDLPKMFCLGVLKYYVSIREHMQIYFVCSVFGHKIQLSKEPTTFTPEFYM